MTADAAWTFGGRSYDPPKCRHGCCVPSVCEDIGDCDVHDTAPTVEEIAGFWDRGVRELFGGAA